MVYRDQFRMLSDEKRARYKFEFCEGCELYDECELVEEYARFRDNHPPIHKPQAPQIINGVLVVQAQAKIRTEDQEIQEIPLPNAGATVVSGSGMGKLSYDQEELKNGCMMSRRYVYQIPCGGQRVTEGIGDHYKIETLEDSSIVTGIEDRWEPLQPIFISAQTGRGKNYFIENELIPYVKDLNYRNTTKQRVLILSNRLALKQQIKNRLNGVEDPADEIYPYKGFSDVMTYQSLLRQERRLKKKQKRADSRYVYVICDEAHFFTSDAMFNPHTAKILSAIVSLFQDAVRVYMSATPYECLKYIIEYEREYHRQLNLSWPQEEDKSFPMAFYHFKRDYSYLDVKAYSSINELYGRIVESVNKRRERWLIFIDDIEKCKAVKKSLEEYAEKNGSPMVIRDGDSKIERVFAVDASSKANSSYRSMVLNECLDKNTYVLISTSVLDNGVNLTGISNIVVSDMAKVKCLQMLGRARVSNADDRKTLYMQRFNCAYVDKRLVSFETQKSAYLSYQLAYHEQLGYPLQARVGNEYAFLDKYYNGDDVDWKNAKHWFGRPMDKPTELYLNKIAKSLLDRRTQQYQAILDEMIAEGPQDSSEQQEKIRVGQKYLEHQLSWFGRTYCEDDDITYADKDKAKKALTAFLESYAASGEQIEEPEKMAEFQKAFTELYDAAFARADKNIGRDYKYMKMNSLLEDQNIDYMIEGKPQKGPWTVIRFNREDDCPETK